MGELRDVGPTAPAYQHVGVGQELHVSLGSGETLLWRGVLAHQLGTHLLLVELYHDPAGSVVHLGMGTVVEDGDGAVSLAASVVLEGALVPVLISKSLFLPSSRHVISPLSRSTL